MTPEMQKVQDCWLGSSAASEPVQFYLNPETWQGGLVGSKGGY